MPKCLFTFPKLGGRWPADIPDLLKAKNIELKTNPLGRWYTEDELIAELKDVDAVLAGGDPYSSRVIEASPKLKIIARLGVGYENVDIPSATRRRVYVTWTPIPEVARGVADEAFGLIIGVLRKIPQLNAHVRSGGWDLEEKAAEIVDIYPLTLGIVGLGRIGTEVARRARVFGMNVLYNDVVRKEQVEKELGIEYSSLDHLLKNSDVVTLHAPLSQDTRKMIGERELSLMKSSAILVNTSRGGVLDEYPLFRALSEGRLAGAGLSVFSSEPPDERSPFYKLGDKLPNVIVLPHIGAGAHTIRKLTLVAIEDVAAVLDGRRPKFPINKQLLAM